CRSASTSASTCRCCTRCSCSTRASAGCRYPAPSAAPTNVRRVLARPGDASRRCLGVRIRPGALRDAAWIPRSPPARPWPPHYQRLPDLVSARTLPGMSGMSLAAYQQQPDAIGGSLGLSALVSLLPLAVVLVLLGGFKVRAQWAALAGLVTALLVAILGFAMPVGMAIMAGLHGAFYGLFPIMWIVVNALWIFNMTVATGHFDILRRSFGAFSADQRTQAILIAFCFGALLEALAGFGAPVAITS